MVLSTRRRGEHRSSWQRPTARANKADDSNSYGPPQQGYGQQPPYGGYPQQPVRRPLPLALCAVADQNRIDAIPAGPSPAGHCEGEEGPWLPWYLSCSSLLLLRLRRRLRVLRRMLRGEPRPTPSSFKRATANATPSAPRNAVKRPVPQSIHGHVGQSPNTRNSRPRLRRQKGRLLDLN